MDKTHLRSQAARRSVLNVVVASLFTIFTSNAEAAVSFLGVAAGDASSTKVTLWTRAVDSAAPANTTLTLQITTDPAFAAGITQLSGACTTDSTKDFVCKVAVGT
jgi:phosphodiesterase/alkaline phosphatase D-like protein